VYLMGMTKIGASLALCAVLLGRGAGAQQADPWDYRAPRISRQQLEGVLARFEAAAQSPAYSEGLRVRARTEADSVRARLRVGDFRVGDRLRITVDGQPQLTDTFAVVTAGPALVMSGIGTVPFDGVLRSEVDAHLSRAVDRVYRGAVVRVRLLTSVAVVGGVVRPGFHSLPSDALVDDAITAAGGLAGDAGLQKAYIERGRVRLWDRDSLQVAMRERRTLGDLGVQDGDRLVIPPPGVPRNPYQTVQLITAVASVPLSVFAVLQLLGWWKAPTTAVVVRP
jgi:protein involved in polysaccharide export with SLBB domain